MTVTTRIKLGAGFSKKLGALALGAALIALPGAAFAQHDDHHDGDHGGDHGGGNGAPHQQQAPRPEAPRQEQARPPAPPAPRAAPAPAERGGNNPRGVELWNAQNHAGRGNPGGINWQGRSPAPNPAPQQGRPADQGQPRGDGAGRTDGGRNEGGRNDGGRNDGGRNDGGQWRNNGPARPEGGQYRNNGNTGRPDGGQWRNDGGPGRNDGGRDDRGQWRHDGPGRNDGGQWRRDGNDGRNNGGQWSHNWRQDNRYDWRGWRDHNRDTFRVGRYYPPYRDYSYNRLSLGFYLQPNFFGSDYWIADPWYYRLPPAYGPYHWVRYYNDVVLVNTYTGQVADVIYDFFW